MKTRYKFLKLEDGKIKSASGDCTWEIGEWKKEDKADLCNRGFHCSKEIYQAFSYVQGEVLAEVEVKGKSDIQDDKEAYTEMKIVKAWKWQKKDSVALSIFAAELCLENFEKAFPNDKRPREAIEAAKKWIAEPIEANRSAAWSAAESAWSAAGSAAGSAARSAAGSAARSAAWSAWSAGSAGSAERSAAWSAAESAWSAAGSAERSAAWSAESAARSAAGSAAWSAESARKKVFTAITKWFDNHLK